MLFELTNAPATFMDIMNRVCRQILDLLVIMLIDDILVYSKTKVHYEDHLREVLETLRRVRLYAKFSKCEFWLCEVQFLGHVVNQKGILIDPAKIEVVMRWEVPRTPGMILLRQRLCEAPILTLPEGMDDFVVYCDASISGLVVILM